MVRLHIFPIFSFLAKMLSRQHFQSKFTRNYIIIYFYHKSQFPTLKRKQIQSCDKNQDSYVLFICLFFQLRKSFIGQSCFLSFQQSKELSKKSKQILCNTVQLRHISKSPDEILRTLVSGFVILSDQQVTTPLKRFC